MMCGGILFVATAIAVYTLAAEWDIEPCYRGEVGGTELREQQCGRYRIAIRYRGWQLPLG